MAPLVVDPCGYLKPHHSVGHCLPGCSGRVGAAQDHPPDPQSPQLGDADRL